MKWIANALKHINDLWKRGSTTNEQDIELRSILLRRILIKRGELHPSQHGRPLLVTAMPRINNG